MVWKKKVHCFHSPNLKVHNTETSWPLLKIFQKLVSNKRADLFPKVCNRVTKQFSSYRCIIVGSRDLNAGR